MTGGSNNNSARLRLCKKNAMQLIEAHLLRIADSYGDAATNHIAMSGVRTFTGFTGNTQMSYMYGVYYYGLFIGATLQRLYRKRELRTKIPKGGFQTFKNPYEGGRRSVMGQMPLSAQNYGRETSLDILREHTAMNLKQSVAIVVTTGTEYSQYLEAARGLNVLSSEAQADTVEATLQDVIRNRVGLL